MIKFESSCTFKGEYTIRHVRNGVTIGEYTIQNGVTIEGLNRMFELWFNGATNPPVVMGLIDGNLFGAVSPNDTAASHSGWTPLTGIVPQPATFVPAGSLINLHTSTVDSIRFDIPVNSFVRGIYLQTNDNLYLWSTAIYPNGKSLIANAGDVMFVNYTVSGSSSTVNRIKDLSINRALDLWFNSASANSPVVMGLIDLSGFTGFSADDTVASHPGWMTYTDVDSPLQPLFLIQSTPVAGQAEYTTDVSTVVGTRFNITGSGTLNGAFIQTDDDAYLWSTISGRLKVNAGDSIFVIYILLGKPLT